MTANLKHVFSLLLTLLLNQWVHVALVLNTALKNAVVNFHGNKAYEMKDLPVRY